MDLPTRRSCWSSGATSTEELKRRSVTTVSQLTTSLLWACGAHGRQQNSQGTVLRSAKLAVEASWKEYSKRRIMNPSEWEEDLLKLTVPRNHELIWVGRRPREGTMEPWNSNVFFETKRSDIAKHRSSSSQDRRRFHHRVDVSSNANHVPLHWCVRPLEVCPYVSYVDREWNVP